MTLKVKLCPAFSVMGTLRPELAKPVPFNVAFEIVIGDPPELVMTSDFVCVLPTATPLKLMLVGLAVKAPIVTPAPERGMLRVGLAALLSTVRFPVAFPAVPGEKETLKLTLCPA